MSATYQIKALGSGGDGIAETPKGPVYIPFALPGEVVTADIVERKKGSARAALKSVETASPDRVEAPCVHFGSCGGCALQHLHADRYRTWTRDRIATALSHHGFRGHEILDPVLSAPGARRRTAVKAHRRGKRVQVGYTERASHVLVDISMCPVLSPALLALIEPIRGLLLKVLKDNARATLHLTETASGIDLLIEAAAPLTLDERETLAGFAHEHNLAGLVWREGGFDDPVAVREAPMLKFGGVPVRIPSAGFLQATADGEAALAKAVVSSLAGAKTVVDLFSGVGTFTFPLAVQGARVLAVEGAKSALDCLTTAARASGLGATVVAEHRDLFRRPLLQAELDRFDAVVIDPPRAGAEAQIAALAGSSVGRIAAVSCNPSTFARDARMLVDGGYEMGPVLPVGQFLWSAEVELAVLFSRG